MPLSYTRLPNQPTTARELWELLMSLMNRARSITEFEDDGKRIRMSKWVYMIDISRMDPSELGHFVKTLEEFGHRIAKDFYGVYSGILYHNNHLYALYHVFLIDRVEGLLLFYDELHDWMLVS